MITTSTDIPGAWAIISQQAFDEIFERWPDWPTDYRIRMQIGGETRYFVFGPTLAKVAVELNLPMSSKELRKAFELEWDDVLKS